MPVVIALVLAVVAAVVLVRRDGSGNGGVAPLGTGTGRSSPAVDRFFAEYVNGDGRVVRPDHGGDTVSEGQAYALLLAAATEDPDRFRRVWKWTKENLQRDDGLLSWKWAGGRVVDPEPATDADLDAARALVMAGRTFGEPGLVEEGKRLGLAILDHATAEVGGELVLLPGPWAARERFFNPSYVSPCTYAVLEEATGDPRWARLEQSGNRLVGAVLAKGELPPDWG
ncbi:MAG: glycoside hydrolase, partial [Actinobacteria bacterium]|nr:glycoside hydrolase [Actinomycetota bacterium]